MKNIQFQLKKYYDFLGNDSFVEGYIIDNMADIGRKDDKRPVVVICPGGGYEFCSPREGEPIALNFMNHGYNAFVINYSTKGYKFPCQLLEIAALMELIKKNEDEWHCDSSRIAIIGFSAGGHLAAHYSNCFDIPEVREYFPDSLPVKACILAYPVITAKKGLSHENSFRNLLGKPEIDENDIEKFSLENRVSEKTPPTYIWHAIEDTTVPPINSLLYATSLTKYKIPFELHIFPFGGHGSATVDYQTCTEVNEKEKIAHSWIEEANTWLEFII